MTEYKVTVKWPKGIFDKYTLVVEPTIKSDSELLDFVRQNEQQDEATGVKYRYQTYVKGKPLTRKQFMLRMNAIEKAEKSIKA